MREDRRCDECVGGVLACVPRHRRVEAALINIGEDRLDPEFAVGVKQVVTAISAILSTLDVKEHVAIRRHIMDESTLKEVGTVFLGGRCPERIRQIESRGLRVLRERHRLGLLHVDEALEEIPARRDPAHEFVGSCFGQDWDRDAADALIREKEDNDAKKMDGRRKARITRDLHLAEAKADALRDAQRVRLTPAPTVDFDLLTDLLTQG